MLYGLIYEVVLDLGTVHVLDGATDVVLMAACTVLVYICMFISAYIWPKHGTCEGTARQPGQKKLGTPAGTTRGFGNDEFVRIGHLIGDVLDGLAQNSKDNSASEARVREDVRALCRAFPIYQ